MERGVIASPGIINPIENGFNMERQISGEELRYYVLYWDKVVIPGNNLVYIQVPEEEEFIACGAIERPRIQFQGAFGGDMLTSAILSCQGIAAERLIQQKNVDWVIHQIGSQRVFSQQFNQRKNVLRIELAELLPVPNSETPIHEILEFKDRRKDELSLLHATLDELYLDVLKSPDDELVLKKNLALLSDAISDVDNVMKEKFEKRKKFDLSTSINLNPLKIASGAAAGLMADLYAGGKIFPISTVAGAVMGAVKIQAKASLTFQPAENNLKLDYLSSAHREGIVDRT